MDLQQLFGLEGRVALVSGASSGIGLHLAGTLAAAGAAVALAARRTDRLEAAVADLQAQGRKACAVALDVTKSDTIVPALDRTEALLGGRVDILVNNAGILYSGRFVDQDEAEVSRVLDTNLKGAFMVAQAAARRMAKAGGGAIINVASTAGLRAAGFLSSYAASKAALIQLTRVMALELAGKGVRVNAVCPGNIETDMHQTFRDGGLEDTLLKRIPQRRFGQPDDLDGAVLLLASDAGRYMTGAAIPVDGGQTLSWM
ncbi:MAG: glucose 1-dehydrogenase [Rhodocyclaceae bacterium]|nr:glucose 1-dehydrogenase [Rhodocyclaceae bacterium]